jgi:hypothetical protein
MFDITNKSSFDEIIDMVGEIQKMKEAGPQYHCVLVGYVHRIQLSLKRVFSAVIAP